MHPFEYISSKFQRVRDYAHARTNQIRNAAETIKTYAKNNIITPEERERIKQLAEKVFNFIKDNRSIIFFGLTVLFSYYMAPANAVTYLTEKGLSLKNAFLTGVFLGAGILALKNIFIASSNKKENPNNKKMSNEEKANWLISITNICQTLISPIAGLVYSTTTTGLILIKTAYIILSSNPEEVKNRKLFFLLPMSQQVKN